MRVTTRGRPHPRDAFKGSTRKRRLDPALELVPQRPQFVLLDLPRPQHQETCSGSEPLREDVDTCCVVEEGPDSLRRFESVAVPIWLSLFMHTARRFLPNGRKRRQQQGGQDGDNGHDDKQFDQGKRRRLLSESRLDDRVPRWEHANLLAVRRIQSGRLTTCLLLAIVTPKACRALSASSRQSLKEATSCSATCPETTDATERDGRIELKGGGRHTQ